MTCRKMSNKCFKYTSIFKHYLGFASLQMDGQIDDSFFSISPAFNTMMGVKIIFVFFLLVKSIYVYICL